MSQYDHIFKLLIVGDSGSGKSNILTRFADNQFTQQYLSTIGVDFKIRNIELNNKNIKLQIWDTAGQQRFRTITASYYRGANAAIIVYDVTEKSTFDNLAKWKSQIIKYGQQGCHIAVFGNKIDLASVRQVTYEEGKVQASKLNAEFEQVSAKTGENIESAFISIVQGLLNLKQKPLLKPNIQAEPIKQQSLSTAIEDRSTDKPEQPQEKEQYKRSYKIVLVGETLTGKSSLLNRFSQNTFTESYLSTIGVDFKMKFFSFDNQSITLQIWDTAGQERFRTIIFSYYQKADAAIIVYDITNRQSFKKVNAWVEEIKTKASQKCQIFLVGNKSDLCYDRVITEGEGRELANSLKINFYETSAKNNENVDGLFKKISSNLLASNQQKQ